MFGTAENKSATTFNSTSSEPSNKIPAFGSGTAEKPASFGSATADKPKSTGFSSTFGSSNVTSTLFGNSSAAVPTTSTNASFVTANSTPNLFGGIAKSPAVPTQTQATTPGDD